MRITLDQDNVWFDVVGETESLIDGKLVPRPTVIFVHGGGGNHRAARPWANALSDVAQCILLDLPGHGRSSRSSSDRWNLDDWADTLASFCARLGIHSPILLGASMGGFVVQNVAIRHPGLASKLILSVTGARLDKVAIAAALLEFGGETVAQAYQRHLDDPGDAAAGAAYSALVFPLYSVVHGASTLEVLSRYGVMGPVERASLAQFSKPGGEFETFDFRSALERVHAPTLVIAAERDPIMPLAVARELQASFPSGVARLEVIANASHVVTLDQPDAYLSLIRDFVVQRVPQPAVDREDQL